MPDDGEKEILIPEVLPPAGSEQRFEGRTHNSAPPTEQRPTKNPTDRVANFFGPIFSGAVLDLSHVERLLLPGFFLGFFLGFWFGRVCALRLKYCFWIALVSAVLGFKGLGVILPIATISGLYFAIKNTASRSTQ